MPVAASDLLRFSSANVPTADTGTAGGARSTTSRPELTQWSANAVAAVLSDGADTRTATVRGRLASGAIDTEALVLNGTTEVVGAKTWERILSITIGATDAARTVTLRQGSGGASRATIGPNETKRHIAFQESVSETGIAIRYEKHFARNAHGTLSLLSANLKLTADPAARIRIGICAAVNDTTSVADRKTGPGVTFVDDNVAQNVPGTDLAAGADIGYWVEQNLPANDPANRSTYTVQLAGATV